MDVRAKIVRTLGVIIVGGALVFALAACGGDDDDGDEGEGATVAAPTSGAATTPDTEPTTASDETPPLSTPIAEGTDVSAETTTIVATAEDFSFSFDVDSVKAGSIVAVTFNNDGQQTHTLTFYKDAAFGSKLAGGDSGETASGETSGFQLTDPAPESGVLHYRCELHSGVMFGELPIE